MDAKQVHTCDLPWPARHDTHYAAAAHLHLACRLLLDVLACAAYSVVPRRFVRGLRE